MKNLNFFQMMMKLFLLMKKIMEFFKIWLNKEILLKELIKLQIKLYQWVKI